MRLNAQAARQSQQAQHQYQSPSSQHPSSHRYTSSPPQNYQQESQSSSSSSSSSSREQQHKVYLLNCKHCGNFLSDRGMKAVLLLKPNITLFSTDAAPTTCGPLYSPSRFSGGADPSEPPLERTCDCLTQSLGCYGCGAQVGYNIVSPCSRCTNSVIKHQRSSNGHRTVLHCSEITVRERRYVPGEPGVRASLPPPPTYIQASNSAVAASSVAIGRRGEEEEEGEEEDLDAEKRERGDAGLFFDDHHQLRYHSTSSSSSSPSSSSVGSKEPRIIRRGDVVYWSDLVPGGERTEPFDPEPFLSLPVVGR
ncbi:hypothetical protein IE53DRAFT_321365 [Violaceomyces palustris]|uniref:Uncharacterized protein n=1 Tax=Violaceomyces palustris TaxID=1673888 RepID=A0ACD0NNM2_9BASI|nr:hypothetical protein IE53DRAFT_321365 [Violaceomyces palustris]